MKDYPDIEQPDPIGELEVLLSMASGVGSQIPAGLGGMLTLLSTLDPAQAAETVGKITEDLTYTPRTEGGQEALLGVAEHPVMKGLEKAQTWMGDKGYDLAGPIGGVIGELAPDLIDLVIGSHGAGTVDNAMFAGIKAANADLKALEKAKWEKAAGVMSEADIWKKHGWMQGKDGKWRFEIDDGGSHLKRIDSQSIGHHLGGFTGVFHHPEVYKNYPSLEATHVNFRAQPGGSYAVPKDDWVDEFGRIRGGAENITAQHPMFAGEGETVDTLLHEIQHAIQAREGFDIGENTASFSPYKQPSLSSMDELHDIIGPYLDNVPAGTFEEMAKLHPVDMADKIRGGWFNGIDLSNRDVFRIGNYISKYTEPITPFEKYTRNIGETEARNTETRRYLGNQTRRNSFPELTADRPRSITQPSNIDHSWPDNHPLNWVGQ